MFYFQGATYIKTSVLKDDHTFTVHIIDPKDSSLDESQIDADEEDKEGAEKSEFEKPEKENKDGEFMWFDSCVGSVYQNFDPCG